MKITFEINSYFLQNTAVLYNLYAILYICYVYVIHMHRNKTIENNISYIDI